MIDFCVDVKDINVSDPYILADEESGLYYLYCQMIPGWYPGLNRHNGFFAFCSRDLIHWSKPAIVFDGEQAGFWADKDFWAPECHKWGFRTADHTETSGGSGQVHSKYVLISSFRAAGTLRRCQCLVADHPLGPFEPLGQPVTPEGWQCLDGTLYAGDDGNPWLVFCHEWLQVGDGQIAAVPLSEELGSMAGDPVILFRGSDAPWSARFFSKDDNHGGGWVTDGPFLYRMADDSLLMLWSSFTEKGYATGYAKSASGRLKGPWTQQQDPLYFHDGGHSMMFRSLDGRLMMALHCPNSPHASKRLLVFEMEDKDGKLHIINEITGNWYNGAKGPADGWVYQESYCDKRGI